MKTNLTIALLVAATLTGTCLAQQTLASKSASFSKSWAVTPRFRVFKKDINLKKTSAAIYFNAGVSKVDLRNPRGRLSGAPAVLKYASYIHASAPVTLFGQDYSLATFSAVGTAVHGIHQNYARHYARGSKAQPSIRKYISLGIWGRRISLPNPSRCSTSKQTSTVYSQTWAFIVPPGIPITIDGDVKLSWWMNSTASASGTFRQNFRTRNVYMSYPSTSVSATLGFDAYGDCTGYIGLAGVGVGLEHEVHLLSPVKPTAIIFSRHNNLGGSLTLTVKPLLVKTWAVVKYYVGTKRWHLFTAGFANWTPYAKQLF